MDRAIAGADDTNELDFFGRNHFSTQQAALAWAKSTGNDFNGKIGREHNAMTERGARNDWGFEQEVRCMLSRPGTMQNRTRFGEISFQLQKDYWRSFCEGPRNAENAGDVN
jgi:hypothetical protein